MRCPLGLRLRLRSPRRALSSALVVAYPSVFLSIRQPSVNGRPRVALLLVKKLDPCGIENISSPEWNGREKTRNGCFFSRRNATTTPLNVSILHPPLGTLQYSRYCMSFDSLELRRFLKPPTGGIVCINPLFKSLWRCVCGKKVERGGSHVVVQENEQRGDCPDFRVNENGNVPFKNASKCVQIERSPRTKRPLG